MPSVPASVGRPGAEVLRGAARGRAALSLVAGAVYGGAVGGFGRTGEAEDAELSDLHAGPKLDRQIGHVGQFQRDVSGEAWVDEARGGVRQQAEAAEAALALEAAGELIAQRDHLERGGQHELTR